MVNTLTMPEERDGMTLKGSNDRGEWRIAQVLSHW
jgi:hypothetical protein